MKTINIKRDTAPTLSIAIDREGADSPSGYVYVAEATLWVGGLMSPFGTTTRSDSKRAAAEEAVAFVLGRALPYVRDEDLVELRALAKLADRAIEEMPAVWTSNRWSADF